MSITTENHPRIQLAELSYAMLQQSLPKKTNFKIRMDKNELNKTLKKLYGHIQTLKYCYLQTPSELEDVSQITSLVQSIKNALEISPNTEPQNNLHLARIFWAFDYLISLKENLEPFPPSSELEFGIDYEVVVIRNIAAIPKSELFVTKVFSSKGELQVCTNLKTVKKGMHLGVALLPPAVVGGKVSQGMFLGTKEYPNMDAGTALEIKEPIPEVRAVLKNLFKEFKTTK